MAPSAIVVAGDFEQIVNRHQRRIVGLACHLLGNLEDARDQAQEAFVRLWQQKDRQANEHTISALLTRIVVNLCIDRLRERKRRRLLFVGDDEKSMTALSSHGNPQHEAESAELGSTLAQMAARLKPRQKAIFILRDVEGHSVRETAEIIGCSENNVLVNLHKARKNLRKWLGPYLRT